VNRLLVGVDLGGTNIRAAVATGETTHGDPVRRPTLAQRGPRAVLDDVAECVREAAHGASVDGVAIGIPGPLDPISGVIHSAPNLPGWHEVPAADELSRRLGCRVVVHNDASLAGYAEWKVGAGAGTKHFVFITASTGIGGALILDGDLYDGAGRAGEVGHTPMGFDGPACGQGHPGCLEGTASGTGIANAARQELSRGEQSSLTRIAPEAIDARAVEEAARAGDELAIRLYGVAGRALGRAIGGLVNLLAPEVIVVGGGLINAGELLFTPLRTAVPEIAFEVPLQRCRIVTAALGTDAGLVGAVAWAVRVFGD
jgi:glucokinase